MPRSAHVHAYSRIRSSAAAGIAPREWLIRYVVCSRIGKRSRYSVSDMSEGLSRGLADFGQVAFGGPDIARGRAEQAAGLLLLEDVRRPAGNPRTREHRRREPRRELCDIK